MNVTIAGAGNIGTLIAVHCSLKGHKVRIFNSRPEKIEKTLLLLNAVDGKEYKGEIVLASDRAEETFKGSDLVFVTVPAFCMDKVAEKIEPYVHEGMKICLVPGSGGGELAFSRCMKKGAVLFGMQRVPSIARLIEYGRSVRATGYKKTLYVSALPRKYSDECAGLISSIFDIECKVLPEYLNLTMTPSNPILHTSRLYGLFGDYKPGMVYEENPLFYENWDDHSSKILIACDDELQKVCKRLKDFDLTEVIALKVYYEGDTPEKITEKITGIKAFKGLRSPMKEESGGYVPDLSSRYFTADFPYGLYVLLQIAGFAEESTPYMDRMWRWYLSLCSSDRFEYSDYGIRNYNDFKDFYKQ